MSSLSSSVRTTIRDRVPHNVRSVLLNSLWFFHDLPRNNLSACKNSIIRSPIINKIVSLVLVDRGHDSTCDKHISYNTPTDHTYTHKKISHKSRILNVVMTRLLLLCSSSPYASVCINKHKPKHQNESACVSIDNTCVLNIFF